MDSKTSTDTFWFYFADVASCTDRLNFSELKEIKGSVRAKRLEAEKAVLYPRRMQNPFRYFRSPPEIICLTVMLYIRNPLSVRQVEDLLFERGIDIRHETVRFWSNRFGPMFAAEIRKRRVHHGCIRTGAGTWTRFS